MSRQFDSLYAYRLNWPAIQSNGITIHCKDIDTAYVNAILTILSHSVKVYEDSLGAKFPGNIIALVGREQGKRDILFQNSYDRIIWEYGSDSDLAAPMRGGHHNVYGLCHELGHMTLGFADNELSEAWADHMASFVALPRLFAQMGDSAWPDRYDYVKIDVTLYLCCSIPPISRQPSPRESISDINILKSSHGLDALERIQ